MEHGETTRRTWVSATVDVGGSGLGTGGLITDEPAFESRGIAGYRQAGNISMATCSAQRGSWQPTLDALGGVIGFRRWKGPRQADDERVDRIVTFLVILFPPRDRTALGLLIAD